MAPQEKMLENQQQSEPSDIVCTVRNSASTGDGFDNGAFENDVVLRNLGKSSNDCEVPMKEIQLNEDGTKVASSNEGKKDDDKKIIEPMDFDDILPHIGEFGRYQKILFLMMIPFAFFVAFVYFTQIFITLVPDQHWCWVPELAHLTKEER